ncbi:MAG: cytochrome P450, partial [Rhodobacteraceae bacterium]|nr:cytochrome P450 [Paracoccaceae bacterium]
QDEICGREVRPGDMMMLPIYALHRNICYWDNPDGFEPQRFADSKTANSPAYLPFGAGPRACIGSGFAMQEAIILLAALIRDLHFMLAPGQQPEPVMVLTLRPRKGIRFNVAPLG